MAGVLAKGWTLGKAVQASSQLPLGWKTGSSLNSPARKFANGTTARRNDDADWGGVVLASTIIVGTTVFVASLAIIKDQVMHASIYDDILLLKAQVLTLAAEMRDVRERLQESGKR